MLLTASPISWKSKKQETFSLSSAEAEYRSLIKMVGVLTWLQRLFTELTVPQYGRFPVYYYSQATIHIARNPVFHERSKHIPIDCHFLRTKVQEGLITLHHIDTIAQLAKIHTKAPTGIKHSALLNKLASITSPPT